MLSKNLSNLPIYESPDSLRQSFDEDIVEYVMGCYLDTSPLCLLLYTTNRLI